MAGMSDDRARAGADRPLEFADDYAGSDPDGVPETMAEFVLGLAERLGYLGYLVPSWLPSMFFEAVGRSGDQPVLRDADLLAYEPVIATLVAKSADERRRFHKDYRAYVRNRNDVVVSPSHAAQIRRHRQNEQMLSMRMGRSDESIQAKEREIARREKEEAQERARQEEEARKSGDGQDKKADERPKPLMSQRKIDSLRKKLEKLEESFEKAFASLGHREDIKAIPDMLARERRMPDAKVLGEMARDLQAGMRLSLLTKDAKEMMSLISDLSDGIKKMQSVRRAEERERMRATQRANAPEKSLDEMRAELDDLKAQRQRMEEQQRQFREDFGAQLREIAQLGATGLNHRPEFVQLGNQARWGDSEGEAFLDRNITTLTQDQRNLLHSYIAENAVRFKTRMARNLRTRNKKQIDIPETCRRACSTGGIPMDLRFLRDRRQRARLLMFLDVSGSCKGASDLMLTFMYQMADVFPGGCKAYAFVNSLYDVSEMFDVAVDAQSAVREVLSTVPTRGVYSDYHTPFDDFRRNHMSEVTRDTVVFFIGDARNNQNPSGEDNVKAIARRAKRAFWLNTEKRDRWNKADSIIGAYAPYMTQVAEVLTPGDLISFLTGVR